MTANNPDNWYLVDPVNTTWGTDFDQSTTVHQSGGSSIHFKNTTPSVAKLLHSRKIPVSASGGQAPSGKYWVAARVQADSNTAGNFIRLGFKVYDKDDTLLDTESNDFLVTTANVWQWIRWTDNTEPTAAYVRILIGSANTAFNAYVDRINFGDGESLASLHNTQEQIAQGDFFCTGKSGAYGFPGPSIEARSANGTQGAPSALVDTDIVRDDRAVPWTSGDDWFSTPAGRLLWTVDGTPGATHVPGNAKLYLNSGSGLVEIMVWDKNKNVGMMDTNEPPNVSGFAAGDRVLTISSTTAGQRGVLELEANITSGSASEGIIQFLNNGDTIGRIEMLRDGANDAAAMAFSTQATGGSQTERVRISSGGYLTSRGKNVWITESAQSSTSDSRTTNGAFSQSYTIPANTLRVGSVIRVLAQGRVSTGGTASTWEVELRLASSDQTDMIAAAPVTNHYFRHEVTYVVRSIGASAALDRDALSHWGSAQASTTGAWSAVSTVDTTGGLTFDCNLTLTGTTGVTTVNLNKLIVDVSL